MGVLETITETFRMFNGDICYSELHYFGKQRILGILETSRETFRKFYDYIWYSKLYNFSL